MDELFWHEAPAAVLRGTKNNLQGKKRDERSYGTPRGKGGDRPLGGINGGLVLMRPSRQEFKDKMGTGPSKTFSRISGKTEEA